MKRQRLSLGTSMSVECGKDWNGLYFTAYARGASVFVRSSQELKRFLKLPIKTASRDALDSWLDDIAQKSATSEGEQLSSVLQ